MDTKEEILKKLNITPTTKHHNYDYLYKSMLLAMEKYKTEEVEEKNNLNKS